MGLISSGFYYTCPKSPPAGVSNVVFRFLSIYSPATFFSSEAVFYYSAGLDTGAPKREPDCGGVVPKSPVDGVVAIGLPKREA